MSACIRCSSRTAGVLALVALSACERTEERVPVTTSIRVEITAPADLGTNASRLPDTQRTVSVELTALDDLGQVAADLDGDLNVQVHFLGSLTPTGVTVPMTAGQGSLTLDLPRALGPTFLWVEDSLGSDPTFATGTSDILWYREPWIEDVSVPDLTRPSTWLERSPYEGKQVNVTESKHGAAGELVVTGVYAQGYTVSDVDCSVSPCVAEPFNHLFIFTFGRPRDVDGVAIELGHRVSQVSGGVGEFNGFTELNFPLTQLVRDPMTQALLPPDETLLPDPVVIQTSWLVGTQDPGGMINLEQVESGIAEVRNGILCPLDGDYVTYQQWKLDLGLGCGTPMNVISAGAASDFDPTDYPAGTVFNRVIGTIRAVNIGTFNVWILQPRRSSDITP